jgi:hypothetical protein
MRSSEFDAFVTALSATSPFLEYDDDSGGALDARLDFACRDAEYRVIVASRDGATGAFQLSVSVVLDTDALLEMLESVGRDAVDQLSADGRALEPGSTVSGELTNTTRLLEAPAQVWLLRGCQNRRVVIDLQSNDFDPYLIVAGARLPFLERNDDGGDDYNSRLEFMCEDSEYKLVVTTLDVLGTFRLSVSLAD